MARQQNNSVMHGTTGLFNSQVVFKTRKDKVYVAGPPTMTRTGSQPQTSLFNIKSSRGVPGMPQSSRMILR